MQYTILGDTDLGVSRLCLGTMNWGEQNTESQAHAQLSLAVERGVNFIDTAEVYPSPPRAETHGRTEQFIGSWLRHSGQRERLVIATKVAGRSRLNWVRADAAQTRLDAANIEAAVEGSLARFGTDYIDLLQLHWPERRTNIFGRLDYRPQPDGDAVAPEETLRALERIVANGKVRHVGVCNETPWGVMRFLEASRWERLPRLVSVQNPYNLLNRTFDTGLAEIAHREGLGLIAYSPLAMGLLSGKYTSGARPPGARLTEYRHFDRYLAPQALQAAERYVALAEAHDIEPIAMALAFVLSRPWTASAITAATGTEQLERNLEATEVTMSDDLVAAIDAIHREYPNPCP